MPEVSLFLCGDQRSHALMVSHFLCLSSSISMQWNDRTSIPTWSMHENFIEKLIV